MKRRIIKIDENKCNGCGLCAEACHEGAIGMVGGKARLLRDDYCDGLGDCLPACPAGAITFEVREATAYDEAAVKARMAEKRERTTLPCGCPGTNARPIGRECCETAGQAGQAGEAADGALPSRLGQWPVQIKLVPPNAPYFKGASLLVAADCTAYAHGAFHERFIKGRITLIGCPKLDDGDYAAKLSAILSEGGIRDVTVVRMEVPCCGGIESAVRTAIENCGRNIPCRVVTISVGGEIVEEADC